MSVWEFYFLFFMSYSTLGWCMEVAVKKIQYGRFINRGFLIGPYCPIYGVGALLITLLLERYRNDPPALFVMGMVTCALLEYLTSYVMERLFHARWWDYSSKRFNINGRICLDTMIPFGLLGMFIMYAVNPLLEDAFSRLSPLATHVVCGTLAAGFAYDCTLSVAILSHVRRENKSLDRDNTEEMAAQVRAALAARGWTYRRLLDAFPNVRHIGEVIREDIEETREKLEESKERLEAELEKLEASHRKREREFEARRQELKRRLEQFRT